MDNFRIIEKAAQAQITERKSKFIAHVMPVESVEEAEEFIASKKKEYWDARHNVSAFTVGESSPVTRCSDDGEPSGTAGRPVLEVITSGDLRNVAIVVTRYFGGILLGTGGLVRAYTQAAQAGIREAGVVDVIPGMGMHVVTDYTAFGKIKNYFEEQQVDITHIDYGAQVTVDIGVPEENVVPVMEKIIDLSNGTAEVSTTEPIMIKKLLQF
ncbi:MAG: YigZ family protein [Eubacterium sp.]|nr:YigZ family protein [Eubacterium sp.]